MINMGHGSFRNISMGNVNIKRPLLLESHGKIKANSFSAVEMKDGGLQIREAFLTELREKESATWNTHTQNERDKDHSLTVWLCIKQ